MKIGYTAHEACKVSDISYRQLTYWDKTSLLKPSISGARGTGSRRIYSYMDLVCLRVTAKLKAEGISVQKIRKSIDYLIRNFPEQKQPLADSVFLTDGETIFVLTEDPMRVLDTLHGGQIVWSVAIGHLAEDTRNKIISLEREEVATGHVFEVVIEPDRDAFLAYCPVLPGCITWGHTEAAAFQYIEDAVKLYLLDMIADKEPIPGIGLAKSMDEINPVIRLKQSNNKQQKGVA